MVPNPGAEYWTLGWEGLDDILRHEIGVRRGEGRSGEYAFYWRGQSWAILSDSFPVDPDKTYELSGYFRAESGVFTGVQFSLNIRYETGSGNRYNVMTFDDSRERMRPKQRGKEIPSADIPAEWTRLRGEFKPHRTGYVRLRIDGPGIRHQRDATNALFMDDFSFKVLE